MSFALYYASSVHFYCISDISKMHIKFISPIWFCRIESIENSTTPSTQPPIVVS